MPLLTDLEIYTSILPNQQTLRNGKTGTLVKLMYSVYCLNWTELKNLEFFWRPITVLLNNLFWYDLPRFSREKNQTFGVLYIDYPL